MSLTCETVKVVADNDQGYKVINKDDFDKESDKLFSEKKAKPKKAAPKKKAEATESE